MKTFTGPRLHEPHCSKSGTPLIGYESCCQHGVPAPVLYVITDNGVVTTDTHRTFGEASTRLDTLNQRYPNHGHSIVPLYLHPAPKEPTA